MVLRRGQAFHFAPRNKGESFDASIIRHEVKIAESIKMKPGMKVLDAGCGVGGPMRAIVKATGANVVGITINEYQASALPSHPCVPSRSAGKLDQRRLVNRVPSLDLRIRVAMDARK